MYRLWRAEDNHIHARNLEGEDRSTWFGGIKRVTGNIIEEGISRDCSAMLANNSQGGIRVIIISKAFPMSQYPLGPGGRGRVSLEASQYQTGSPREIRMKKGTYVGSQNIESVAWGSAGMGFR